MADECSIRSARVDIYTDTLLNIDFGLFTVLAFRAADAVFRCEHGASLLYELRSHVRYTAVKLSPIVGPDSLRRVMAHLTQVPLSLSVSHLANFRSKESNDSLLSDY